MLAGVTSVARSTRPPSSWHQNAIELAQSRRRNGLQGPTVLRSAPLRSMLAPLHGGGVARVVTAGLHRYIRRRKAQLRWVLPPPMLALSPTLGGLSAQGATCNLQRSGHRRGGDAAPVRLDLCAGCLATGEAVRNRARGQQPPLLGIVGSCRAVHPSVKVAQRPLGAFEAWVATVLAANALRVAACAALCFGAARCTRDTRRNAFRRQAWGCW